MSKVESEYRVIVSGITEYRNTMSRDPINSPAKILADEITFQLVDTSNNIHAQIKLENGGTVTGSKGEIVRPAEFAKKFYEVDGFASSLRLLMKVLEERGFDAHRSNSKLEFNQDWALYYLQNVAAVFKVRSQEVASGQGQSI